MIARKFVALDRDGTIIEERHYLSDPRQVRLLPGAIEGLQAMQKLNLGLVLVTNQSAIGRGYFDEDQLARIHGRLDELLRAEGIRLDGIYYCPHLPDADCSCRKPRTGMLEQAAGDLGFTPGDAFVVGDNVGDIELGKRMGATTLLVRTGYGERVAREGIVRPDYVVDDLRSAADVIGLCTSGGSRNGAITKAIVPRRLGNETLYSASAHREAER